MQLKSIKDNKTERQAKKIYAHLKKTFAVLYLNPDSWLYIEPQRFVNKMSGYNIEL